eukprot:CAMPEP_0177577856 /NCGR_PEP_ID=MMETSP0419_2-20121207/9_1 /TAXON_ID=582737 /ORGANISM="Tetraselmis sp., Strain GSL018" /LENGTH=283 /DNA_ID=CAMNT_0019066203 /DNA_START=484 /DNA_END=1333 /DNA_ORIENTATION=+
MNEASYSHASESTSAGNVLQPIKNTVTREERVSLHARPAFMPRGDVKRTPCGKNCGDYDPIRHQWKINVDNSQMMNKTGELSRNRRKQVELPEAIGEYNIHTHMWIKPPRGKVHKDREFKPELRSKLLFKHPGHGELAAAPHQDQKGALGDPSLSTQLSSTLVPRRAEERCKLPPISRHKNSTTLPEDSGNLSSPARGTALSKTEAPDASSNTAAAASSFPSSPPSGWQRAPRADEPAPRGNKAPPRLRQEERGGSAVRQAYTESRPGRPCRGAAPVLRLRYS